MFGLSLPNSLETNHCQLWMYLFPAVCPPGQAPDATNTSQCIVCEVGFYSDIDGPQECTICPNNLTTTYNASKMSTDCQGL